MQTTKHQDKLKLLTNIGKTKLTHYVIKFHIAMYDATYAIKVQMMLRPNIQVHLLWIWGNSEFAPFPYYQILNILCDDILLYDSYKFHHIIVYILF